MKIETGTITILRITEVPRLDPIRVTLDDIGPGQGRINIECYGKARASYWGAMGDRTIAQFFASCDNGYLINNLASGQNLWPTRFSGDALRKLCRSTIRGRRKGTRAALLEYDRLTRAEASSLMSEVGDMDVETEADCWRETETLEKVFGQDGVHAAVQASEPNPEYVGLARICDAVRDALKIHNEATQKAAA